MFTFPNSDTIPSMVSLYKEVSLIELTIKSTASHIVYKGHSLRGIPACNRM